jgi:bifunctional DNA-binding transcriptional regulator/antitoxin component of YhaV-PrlF toxin-antitoxin module
MTLTIDGAGRVVIPKPIRDKFGLHAGSLPVGWFERYTLGRLDNFQRAQDRKNLGYWPK